MLDFILKSIHERTNVRTYLLSTYVPTYTYVDIQVRYMNAAEQFIHSRVMFDAWMIGMPAEKEKEWVVCKMYILDHKIIGN